MITEQDIYKQTVYPLIGACHEVHKVLGPFLNEYMYQDAMAIELSLRNLTFEKEFLFKADYKGHTIEHKHYVDFCVMNNNTKMLLECKAVEKLADTHRQQLWNYMRLSGVHLGVLYNFSPIHAQCEKYYFDAENSRFVAF